MNIRKIAIIGCGAVGSAIAYTLMNSGLFTDMVLIDADKAKAEGEAMDMSHCLPYIRPVEIFAGDYSDISDCGIIIIAAGVGQKPGESRLDCLKTNAGVFRSIIPQIAKHNKDGFILVVTNPVDVLSYVAYTLAERSSNRVFGSGTVLDSARLKYAVGKRLNVDPRSVHAFVIGEHGDSELAVWSSANISGIALDEYCEHCGYKTHESNKRKLETEVKNSAYEIIARKGATYYGIAAATKRICESIVRDEHSIMPVSVLVKNRYCMDDVYISLPARIGANGVEDILDIPLSRTEQAALCASAKTLKAELEKL